MRIRRIDLTFTALLLPLDVLALFCAGLGAYLLRYSRFVREVLPLLQNIPFGNYLKLTGIFVGVWIILFVIAGLYSTQTRRAWNELGRVVLACTAGTMALIAAIFFTREVATSRFIVIAVWIFSILFVFLERLLLRVIRHELLRAKIGHRKLVVIGTTSAGLGIAKAYQTHPILGYTVVKHFASWSDETKRALDRLRRTVGVDAVLLAEPDLSKEKALELIAYTEEHHLTFHYLADLFAATFSNIQVSTDTGVPVIEVKRTPLEGWGRIAKRTFDIIISTILLVLVSPVMILTAIAIKLDSKGPIFFSRVDNNKPSFRIGETGQPFRYFKFRSMVPGQHSLRYTKLAHLDSRKGPLVKLKDDPRVTRVGRFIRKWSIDELPEFFLVLRGDMSLVGPRPHLPEEVERYEPQQRRTLLIKPGITGMAQISGRSDLNFDDEARLDTWYIENWSPLLDLYILLKTPFAIIAHRHSED